MIIRLYEGQAASPNRISIVSKSRKEDNPKFQRRRQYLNKKSNCRAINMEDLFTDDRLVIEVDVKGTSTYTCTLAFSTFLEQLKKIVHGKKGSKFTLRWEDVTRAINRAVDDTDVLEVNCTCPDFKYRYAYWATQSGFKYGTPQNDNGKEIRNPNNEIGAVCKHLSSLLANKSWLSIVGTWLTDYIKDEHPEEFAEALDVPLDVIVGSALARKLAKARNAKDPQTKKDLVADWRNDIDKKMKSEQEPEESEELEEEPEEEIEESKSFRNKHIKV